jgi:hypothetical protein
MNTNSNSTGWLFLVSVLAAIILLFNGCGGDLPTASHLERTRVLGARVSAADPGRADALPGETANVEWLVVGPTAAPNVAWAFAVCTGIDGACTDAPTAPTMGTGLPVRAPFTAPATAATLDDPRVPLMIGAVCAGGAPTLDEAGCDAATQSANPTRFAIPVQLAGETPNRHPNLANDAVTFEGAAWTAEPVGDAGGACDAALPVVPPAASADEVRHILIVSDADDRESFSRKAGEAPTPEELTLSSFATGGELAGSYASVPATDTRTDAPLAVKWTPPLPADVPAAGVAVHFHFVLRDGRGGLDWIHRALCVRAP